MSETTTPLDTLHAAVQAFSNAMADNSDQSGVVNHAVIAWEESSFDDEGTLARRIMYASTGDATSPASAMGLATLLVDQLRYDIVQAPRCGED